MTRKSEGATAGLRRGRTLATAGLGAATLIGGLIYAMPANAATAPTVTLTAPSKIDNIGDAGSGTLDINSGSGITAAAYTCAHLVFTGPSTLTTSNTAVAVDGTALTLSGAGGTLTADVPVAAGDTAANFADNHTFTIAVGSAGTAGPTGAVTTVATLQQHSATNASDPDANGCSQSPVVATIATSNTTTTNVVSTSAVTFNSNPVPAAVIYQQYSYNLLSDSGFPTSAADFTLKYASYDSTTKTWSYFTAGSPSDTGSKDSAGNEVYSINFPGVDFALHVSEDANGQVVSAKIVNTTTLDYTDPNPQYTYTVIANNGTGGAPAAGVPANGATPALAQGDVASPAFTLPILFKDVATTDTFANDIYTLANDGIINGQLDGNFDATGAVTRASFAAFAVRELNEAGYGLATGPCSAASPSAFPDVANASLFCSEINDLAAQNIITGYKDGTFGPSTKVSRQVVAAFFYRIQAWNEGAQVTDATPVDTKFADVTKSNIFSGDINWAVNSSPTTIIQGYGDGTFRPTGVATRQVTAAYLARFGQDYLGLWSGVTGL